MLYVWLVAFPLARGEAWAWWTLVVSGAVGFATFLLYLDSGYLDTWHGPGTLLLLPVFWTGVGRSRRLLRGATSWRMLLRLAPGPPWRSAAGAGRALLLATAAGTVAVGTLVAAVGYDDLVHVGPAVLATVLLATALSLSSRGPAA